MLQLLLNMIEYRPTILLPEPQDPSVAAFKIASHEQDLGANLRFDRMELEQAAELLNSGEVDIIIAGAAHDTPTMLRTAIHHVGTPDKFISSFFVMEKDGEEPLFFADCAVHDKPKPNDLVKIAEQTCANVVHLGYEPVVAFLSLSSFGSAAHLGGVQEIQQAVEKFKDKNPDIIAYGEIQVDAALNPRIFEKKSKGEIELVDGKMPNVLIFPDGQSGNIAYKMMEQLAGYVAIGPMLDGIKRDMHDLSRGVTPEALARSCAIAAQLFRARHADELQLKIQKAA